MLRFYKYLMAMSVLSSLVETAVLCLVGPSQSTGPWWPACMSIAQHMGRSQRVWVRVRRSESVGRISRVGPNQMCVCLLVYVRWWPAEVGVAVGWQGYLVQFVVIVLLTNTGFAYMGYVLFGDMMREFHSFDQVREFHSFDQVREFHSFDQVREARRHRGLRQRK